MKRRVTMILWLGLLLVAGAAVSRADWRMKIHKGAAAPEHILADVDSLNYYEYPASPGERRMRIYQGATVEEHILAEVDSLSFYDYVIPPPTGACCNTATGACTITSEAGCGFTWLGDGSLCSPATCAPARMALVPPGTFTMGSPLDEPGREQGGMGEEAQHQVTLTRALYVSKYETTQTEWLAVMGWNASSAQSPNFPVDQVTWFDAVSYCNARSALDGFTPAYAITNVVHESGDARHIASANVTWNQAADGYRLLTEAEWEYTCRATTTTAFCSGPIRWINCQPRDPNLNLVGWYCGQQTNGPKDVGLKAPNAWGLYDMHGNDYEWCWDWFAPYDGTFRELDPLGPPNGTQRVLRGGTWAYWAWMCRSAQRLALTPDRRDNAGTLRVARWAP